jgi:hypothetical protein
LLEVIDMRRSVLILCLVAASAGPTFAQAGPQAPASAAPAAPPALSRAEQEKFLRDAQITKVSGVKKGITGTQRATLSDGTITHDASVQTIDESVARFESALRTEFNFRDYWGYNVAASRLAAMLGLDMVPPSVERTIRGKRASFTWWVDDVMMDEAERLKSKRTPPDTLYWNSQIQILKVFDELIAETDRNAGNMLIGSTWKLWLIDHTRAFRTRGELASPIKLLHCERTMLEKMKALTEDALKAELGDYLTIYEIRAVLKRRDLIVARIEALGPNALFDLRPPRS